MDSIEVVDVGNGQLGLKSLRGLQIVNGGQKTAIPPNEATVLWLCFRTIEIISLTRICRIAR